MDRFDAMQLYVRIVEQASFTRAAEQLGVQRATATQVVKQLEARLGVRLLQRTTRHVSATAEGRAYYQRCVAILAEVSEADQAFLQNARQLKGSIRLDLSGSLWRHVLAPALPRFCERYPHIQFDLSVSDRQIDLVREGVDCVLRIGALRDSTLVARRLTDLPQLTCASAEYVRQYGLPTTWDELDNHRAVNYASASTGKPAPLEFLVDGEVRTRDLTGTVSVNNGDAYVGACEAHFGLIQVPRYHVRRQLAEGSLIEILPLSPPPPLPLSVLYPHRRHVPMRVRVFMDWLVELFQSPSAAQ